MPNGPGGPTDLQDLERHWETWRFWGLTSYNLLYRHYCFCVGGGELVLIRVRDGVVESVEIIDDGRSSRKHSLRFNPTIEDLFELIQRALEEGADDVRVTYHPAFGYPTFARIDYWRSAVDDEIVFEASLLRWSLPASRGLPGETQTDCDAPAGR